MKKIKIFLASSLELKPERELFEIEIYRKNKAWLAEGKDIFLHLDIWEDLSARMSSGGSQSEYNKFVHSADIFILLAFTKVGKFTEEEFEHAVKKLQSNNKFLIFTFFKKTADPVEDSLDKFKKKLEDLKHFLTPFADSNDLWNQFDKELDKLDLKKFGENKSKGFNEILTRRLMDALNNKYGIGKDLLEQANQEESDWETYPNISDPANNIIINSFIGVLGEQLRKLVAIGSEGQSETNIRSYIEICLITTRRALQLICFSLLSKIWDFKKEKQIELSQNQNKVLSKFFRGFELNIEGYITLMENLIEIFVQHGLDFPLADAKTFSELNEINGEFRNACNELHAINRSFDAKDITLLTSFEAEKHLTVILEKLIFFTSYKMISIKSVTYDGMRNNTPHFLHNYSELGIDKVNYVEDPINTDAILLYKERYQESVNLFPFIIDYNALSFEEGSKICFFSNKGLDGKLKYRVLKDNNIEDIVFMDTMKSETKINNLMINKEKRKQLKLDAVYTQFEEAKEAILGK